jgi:CRP-like cAMP-binding protein
LRCSLNDHCERLDHIQGTSHRPLIGRDCTCPFPQSIATLAFTKGQYLFHQGDPVRGAVSLTAGLVALERVDENGAVVIIKLLKPGAFFPCADLFADGIHGTGARALTDVAACFVTAARLMAALAEPELRQLVMRRSGEEARADEDTIFRLCSGDLAERVLAIIEALAEEQGDSDAAGWINVRMPLPWRDVAAMVGTSPEVMSRLLKRLTEAGRVIVTGREVRLPSGRRARATG